MYLILILAFAILNRLRGWNPVEDFARQHGISYEVASKACERWKRWAAFTTSDGFFGIYCGLAVGGVLCGEYGLQHAGLTGLVVAAGLQIWSRPSWGRQDAAINGEWYGEVGTLSIFTQRMVTSPYGRGITYGCLRGFCGLLPLAVGVALLGHGLVGVALAATGAVQGFAYYVGGRVTPHSVIGGEIIMGALLGASWLGA